MGHIARDCRTYSKLNQTPVTTPTSLQPNRPVKKEVNAVLCIEEEQLVTLPTSEKVLLVIGLESIDSRLVQEDSNVN